MTKPQIPTREEMVALLKEHATPIDYEKLEADGVLQKKGAWYQVKDIRTLPEYIGGQVTAVKNDSKGNCFVKLPKSWKKAQQLYKKVTGKEYPD